MPVEGLRKRALTAFLVAIPLAAVVFFMPREYGVVLLTVLALAGAWEWAGFFPRVSHFSRFGYLLLISVLMGLSWYFELPVIPVLWVGMVWWLAAFIWILRFPTPVPNWLITAGGVLVLVPGWLALSKLHLGWGPHMLTFFFLLVFGADTGAYFVGKSIGKTRLAPRVSPGKTREGAAGGLLLVAVIGSLGAYYFDLTLIYLVALCLAVAMASIVGDLTISIFKRNAGLKDSGKLFPGHGGVLDRIDSISAGAPLFLLGLGWFRDIT
ncbi:MAG: phosphatidate cytidylyltransferase [Gammaproteobacteria bacterium]|nr:phosphatidate cytidylyltransferase [Gammaproteobacteria bacterium]NNF67685.1 phosphatidate cytidylyltransferase [Gammaproteobacteria bacterium]